MICYSDADGHAYDFGFGLNWKGVIHDWRTDKYVNQVARPVIQVQNNRVILTCGTPGAHLYYTVDGDTPSFTAAREYSQPFPINKGTTVNVIAKVTGSNNSSLVSRSF